ncbi:hypothetical protein ABZP36_029953 [Zizania latifolia]
MAPKRPAAASGSASEASDREAGGAARRRSRSPSPSRSRSRSKTPPPNLHPNAAVLSSTPASNAVDFAVASDYEAGADARLASRRRSRERSPRLHSDSDNSDAAAAAAVAAASDDGDDEGNATPPPRSRRSSRVEAASIKPISSRPMDGSRRPAAGSSQRRSKRPRSSPAQHSPEQQRRQPRVWNPEDEVTILRALISYRAKNGALPASTQDTGKLHNQIRGQLTVKASTTQLSDKVRRLKHKYNLLLTRGTKNGRDPDLPTAHDREVYELSKKVWGSKSGGASAGSGGGGRVYENADVAESDEEQGSRESDEDFESGWDDRDHRNRRLKAIALANGNGNGNGNAIATGARTVHGNGSGKGDVVDKGKDMYPYLWEAVEELSKEHPSGMAFRKAFGVLEGSRARAMEEKLHRFRLSEIRQQLRRMDLMKETIKMVLDALEGTD